jgi:hypothetical protein
MMDVQERNLVISMPWIHSMICNAYVSLIGVPDIQREGSRMRSDKIPLMPKIADQLFPQHWIGLVIKQISP